MGLKIKKNDKGEYQMISTISDEKIHEGEWISEEKAKESLMTRSFFRFVDEIIAIDMDFPSGYTVDGKRESYKDGCSLDWMCSKKGGLDNSIYTKKMHEVLAKLDITIKIDDDESE